MSWHIHSVSPMILIPDNKQRGKCKKAKWEGLQFSHTHTQKIPTIWANSSVLELNILDEGSTSSFHLSSGLGHSVSSQTTSLSTCLTHTLSAVYDDDVTGDSIKDFTEVEVNNLHCSALIHQVSHRTVEGYHVGQAWISLCESTLTTLSHILVLVCGNAFQEDFLHHFPRGYGKTDWPVLS